MISPSVITLTILFIAIFAGGWQSRRDYIAGKHMMGDVYAAGSILCAGLFGAGMVLQSCG